MTILLSLLFLAVPDVAVEHMGPLYGPMTGDKVYLLLKGRLLKDELIIEVTEDITGLHERLTYTKNCNTVHFSMPKFTQSQLDTVMAQITVYHKGEIIYQKPYSYHGSIDRTYHCFSLAPRFLKTNELLSLLEALAGLNLGDEAASTEGNPSSSNYFDVVNSFAAAGASTVFNSAKKTATTAKRPKRLSNK